MTPLERLRSPALPLTFPERTGKEVRGQTLSSSLGLRVSLCPGVTRSHLCLERCLSLQPQTLGHPSGLLLRGRFCRVASCHSGRPHLGQKHRISGPTSDPRSQRPRFHETVTGHAWTLEKRRLTFALLGERGAACCLRQSGVFLACSHVSVHPLWPPG